MNPKTLYFPGKKNLIFRELRYSGRRTGQSLGLVAYSNPYRHRNDGDMPPLQE